MKTAKDLRDQFENEGEVFCMVNPFAYAKWLENKYLEDCLVWHLPEEKPVSPSNRVLSDDVIMQDNDDFYFIIYYHYVDNIWLSVSEDMEELEIKRWAYLP